MEIHIGERTAEVELVSKDGNKVEVMIDGKPFNVDIVTAETEAAQSCTTATRSTQRFCTTNAARDTT